MRSLSRWVGVVSVAASVSIPGVARGEERKPAVKAPAIPDEPGVDKAEPKPKPRTVEERKPAVKAPAIPDEPGVDQSEPKPKPRTIDERLAELEDELARQKQALAQAREEANRPNPISFFGYVDFGFFVPQGDGTGWVQDYGNQRVPSLAGKYGWVFLGDLLATPVNSRGEAADLGNPPGVQRFDSVHSHGAPGFLLNEVNFGVSVDLGRRLVVNSSVDFVPRTGSNFALGDFFNVDLAQLESPPRGAAPGGRRRSDERARPDDLARGTIFGWGTRRFRGAAGAYEHARVHSYCEPATSRPR